MRMRTRTPAFVVAMLVGVLAALAMFAAPSQAASPVLYGPPSVSSTLVVARPASVGVGDLVVAVVASRCVSGTPAIPTAAGWTPITNNALSTTGITVLYHWFNVADPASYTFTASGCTFIQHTTGTLRVSGVHPTTPVNTFATALTSVAASTINVPSITTTTSSTRLMAFAYHASNTAFTGPAGHVVSWTNTNVLVGGGSVIVADREQTAAGVAPAVPIALASGTSTGIGFHVAFNAITVPVSGRALTPSGAVWGGCSATPNVSVAVAGTRVATVACSPADGSWTTATTVATGDVVTAWLDDDAAGNDGATYTKAVDSVSAITGLDIRSDEVRTATSMTTGELGTFDTTDETGIDDIPVTAPDADTLTIGGTSTLVVGSGTFTHGSGTITTPRLRVASGATFTPGAGHQLVLTGSGTGACGAGTAARPLCVSGSVGTPLTARYVGTANLDVDGVAAYGALVLRPSGGTPTYRLGSVDDVSISAASLTIDGTVAPIIASTTTYSPSVSVAGTVSVTANGTLSGSGSGVVSSTNTVSGAGNVSLTGGTYWLRSSAPSGQAVQPTGAGPAWRFATLRLTTSVAAGSTISTPATARGLTIDTRLVLGDAGDTGTTTYDANTSLTIPGDFETTTKGTLMAPASMILEGDIIHRGSFDPRGGTLTFAGSGTSTMTTYAGSGGTLYDVVVTSPGKTLALATNGGMQIDHHLQLEGTDCANVIRLVSATPGSPQTLHVLGTMTADWASFTDIAATSTLTVTNSGDLGGNSNLVFSGAPPCAGPIDLFTHTTNASAGSTQPTSIDGRGAFHMSFRNNSLAQVDRYRTGISSSWIAGDTAGLWPLDSSGADRAATGGTLTGPGTTPGWVAGASNFGTAADFDGVDDILRAPSHAAYATSTYTVEAWFRTSTIANGATPSLVGRALSGSNVQFGIWFDRTSKQLVAGTTAGGTNFDIATPAAPWLDDTWHHVAFTADGSRQLRLYVDGVLYASGSYTGTMDQPASPIWIGGTGDAGDYFDGMLDDVQLTSRAMLPAEIAGYVATGRPHAQVVWQSTAPDGTLLGAPCTPGDRCVDTTYGGADLHRAGARWFVAHQTRTVDGLWSNFSVDWFETSDAVTVAPVTPVSFAAYTPGVDATASTTITTTCTVPTGCAVVAQGQSQTVALSTLDNGGGIVPHIAPASPSAPGAWGAGAQLGLGFTVLQTSSGKSTGTWGTGTDFSNLALLRFVGVTRAPVTLVTTASAGTETTTLGVRLNTPSSATVGNYAGQFTVVAIGNL